ncbi:MAG: hypothetical protein ACLFPS_09900, partial [Clostridia bacterium]
MNKRLLAMLFIIAMMASMFSGVDARKEIEYKYEIDLDNDTIYYGTGSNSFKRLSGRILNENGAVVKEDFTIDIHKVDRTGRLDNVEDVGTTSFAAIDVKEGVFDAVIPTSSDDFGVGEYTLFHRRVGVSHFKIINEIEIEEPTSLSYDYPIDGRHVIQGNFVNGDFDSENHHLILAYVQRNDFIDSKSLSEMPAYINEEEFGFIFDGEDIIETGEIGIFILAKTGGSPILASTLEVNAGELDVSMAPKKLLNSLDDIRQEVELNFGAALEDDHTVKVSIKDKIENPVEYTVDDFIQDRNVLTIDFENDFNISSFEKDDYTIVVELCNDITTTEKKEIEFKVEEPKKYTLVNWTTDKLTTGLNYFRYGNYYDDSKLKDIPAGEVINQVHVVKVENGISSTVNDINLTFTYEDDDNSYVSLTRRGDFYKEAATNYVKTGTLDMELNIFEETDDNLYEEVASFEKKVEVEGWDLQTSTEEIVVGTETDLEVEITDEKGRTINNAVLELFTGDEVIETVNGAEKNINKGKYVFGDIKIDEIGFYYLRAFTQEKYNDGNYEDYDELVIKVDPIKGVGEEVYTVTSDKKQLLNGIKDKITVTALDEEGNVVYPIFSQVDYDEDGDPLSDFNDVDMEKMYVRGLKPIILPIEKRLDLDGDGVKESVELTVTPSNLRATKCVISATTDDGHKIGKIEFEVVKPKVKHTGATVITENIETALEFSVVDPRDENVIFDEEVFLQELEKDAFIRKYATYKYVDGKELEDNRENVWSAGVLVTEADYEKAKEDESEVEASLRMIIKNDERGSSGWSEIDLDKIKVVKPTLEVSPEKAIIGS